jgi:4-hydroxybenzoate polyprenyltransferase
MFVDIKYIVISMRPNQWVKNVFIFAGLLFSRNLFQTDILIRVSAGFVLFSLAASSIYIFNDIEDIEYDRKHVHKCQRPLAAGQLAVRKAYVASLILMIIAFLFSSLLNLTFFGILCTYVILNLAYSLKIKHLVILDIMFIAFGFVLRVFAGTSLAGVRPSDWLILCTLALSLFLGFTKRRQELGLANNNSEKQRKVLTYYSIPFLDQMIAMVTACTVMSYALYTVSTDTITRFGTRNLVFTIPLVLYGMFRYLYIIYHKQAGDDPTTSVLTDIPLIINALLWVVVVGIVIY